jgi:hypothetical protein
MLIDDSSLRDKPGGTHDKGHAAGQQNGKASSV